MDNNEQSQIWVVNGVGGRFPCAVFSTRELGEEWIRRHSITGVLTAYPLNKGVYDWAIEAGYFSPNKVVTPELIGRFSSAYQEHYHYEEGLPEPQEG